MQFESQKCHCPRFFLLLIGHSLRLGQTDAGQKPLKDVLAGLWLDAAIGGKQFDRILEGDRLLTPKLLVVFETNSELHPYSERMIT